MKSRQSMRTPLGKVRGLGSARRGVSHWWLQRVTAMGLIPLAVYLVVSLVTCMGKDYVEAIAWMRHPFNASVMILLLGAGFYHASLGLQVIIEDYVSNENRRLLSLVLVKLLLMGLSVLSLFSVLSIALS